MAIRFQCPSCRQPIEVDDAWREQSVACPYCRNVVTAPASSTWPPGQVPVASPSRSAFAPPPPPGPAGAPPAFAPPGEQPAFGYAAPPPAAGGNLAVWALILAIASAVLCTTGGLTWFEALFAAAVEKAGPSPTQKELEQVLQDMVARRELPRSPLAMMAVGAGTILSIAGLFLAIRALMRGDPRRVTAVAACVISISFLVCQMLLMLMMVGSAMAHA